MSEWLRWAIGIVLPLLVAHGVWATVTIIRLRHIVEGTAGDNGVRHDVRDLSNWREGKHPYGPYDLESRCRHAARNLDQEMIDKLEEQVRELKRRPR